MREFESANSPGGTTPVSPDEARWLIPSITSLSELNLLERENILEARRWLFSPRTKRTCEDLLDYLFVRDIHRRMFRHVWRWAGKFRDIELNLGVSVATLSTSFTNLLEDAKVWIEFQTYPPDEIAVRVHHGLVLIHPWLNGNGRHARLLADRLIYALGQPSFTWGGGRELTARGDTRTNYLDALREADAGDFTKLIEFART